MNLAALSYVYTVLDSTAENIGGVDIANMRNRVTALYEYYDAAILMQGKTRRNYHKRYRDPQNLTPNLQG